MKVYAAASELEGTVTSESTMNSVPRNATSPVPGSTSWGKRVSQLTAACLLLGALLTGCASTQTTTSSSPSPYTSSSRSDRQLVSNLKDLATSSYSLGYQVKSCNGAASALDSVNLPHSLRTSFEQFIEMSCAEGVRDRTSGRVFDPSNLHHLIDRAYVESM